MFRIVEDTEPPIPETVSPLLDDFLRKCFQKDPASRPDAEKLFEHEWLKKNWGLPNVRFFSRIRGRTWLLISSLVQDLRPQDSIPFLRRVSADYNKTDIRFLLASNNEFAEPKTLVRDETLRIEEPAHTNPPPSSPPRPMGQDSDNPAVQEHSFVKTTFSKRKW